MPITSDWDSLVPVLRLPPLLATIRNEFLPTISSTISTAFTTNLQHPQPLNPVSTFATGEQYFPMTIAFHTRQSTPKPSSAHCHTLPEWNPVSNTTRDRISPAQSPVPFASLCYCTGRRVTCYLSHIK